MREAARNLGAHTEQGAFDVADGCANGGGAIENYGGVNALGNGGPDGGDFGADAVDSVNDVGAGLAEDGEQNSAFAVQVAGGANVLNGIDDVGDIGEVDRGPFVIPDDDGLEVRGMGHLIVGDDIGGGDAVGDLALGEIGILQAENGLDVGHRQTIAGELGWVYFDADGGERTAADVDLSDALNLGELLLDDGGGCVEEPGGAVFIGGEAEDHDGRIGGIDFAVGGVRREIRGEIGACGIDGGFDIAGGAVDIAGEIELDGDGS